MKQKLHRYRNKLLVARGVGEVWKKGRGFRGTNTQLHYKIVMGMGCTEWEYSQYHQNDCGVTWSQGLFQRSLHKAYKR